MVPRRPTAFDGRPPTAEPGRVVDLREGPETHTPNVRPVGRSFPSVETTEPPGPDHASSAAEPASIAVAIAGAPRRNADPTAPDDGPPDVPTVVASGRGARADRILDLAFAQGIKVREDPDLAEMLGAVEIGEEIPLEAFLAVGRILEYVFSVNGGAAPVTNRTGRGDDGAVQRAEAVDSRGRTEQDDHR